MPSVCHQPNMCDRAVLVVESSCPNLWQGYLYGLTCTLCCCSGSYVAPDSCVGLTRGPQTALGLRAAVTVRCTALVQTMLCVGLHKPSTDKELALPSSPAHALYSRYTMVCLLLPEALGGMYCRLCVSGACSRNCRCRAFTRRCAATSIPCS
jgi:hypothetical protein